MCQDLGNKTKWLLAGASGSIWMSPVGHADVNRCTCLPYTLTGVPALSGCDHASGLGSGGVWETSQPPLPSVYRAFLSTPLPSHGRGRSDMLHSLYRRSDHLCGPL